MDIPQDRFPNRHALTVAAQRVLMSEIARLIVHELSQPLAAVATNAGACARWLRHEPPDLAEADAGLQRIAREARFAGDAMRGIQGFLRPPAATNQPVDLAVLFRECVDFTRPALEAAGIEVVIADGDMPGLPHGDPAQIFQVLACLLANAVEAVSKTDGPRRIELSARTNQNHDVEVSVRDTGPGVDPESREHMFDAFHTTKADAFGLGLPVSRSILESQGGRLWLDEAAPAPGATFRFTLPTGAP